jgi:quinol monooxygenase YgiN
MTGSRGDSRKYIIGWLRLKPGQGSDFVSRARTYAAGCREEDGCLFFEFNPSIDNPDVFVVAECFRDADAHEAHLKRALFLDFWKGLDEIALSGKFENVFADAVIADSATFGTGAPGAVNYHR